MPPSTRSASESGPTRRSFLRAGALTLAGGSAASAGCIEVLPPLGQRVRVGSVAVPPATPPTYRAWIPAPSAVPTETAGLFSDVMITTPGETGQDVSGHSFSLARQVMVSQLDWFGQRFEQYDWAMRLGNHAIVLSGGVDRSAAESAIEGTEYEPVETHHGYDLYTRTDVIRTVAIGDDAIVFSRSSQGSQIIKAMLDAKGGRVPRYHEVDADIAAITSAVGLRPFGWMGSGHVGDDSPAVLGSASFSYDESAVYLVNRYLYPSADAVPIKRHKRNQRSNEYSLSGGVTDVHQDGRIAVIARRMTHEQAWRDSVPRFIPHITWGFEFDEQASSLTIHHEAGDSIDADLFTISYFGSGAVNETDPPQFSDVTDSIAPGDSLTLDLSEYEQVNRVRGFYEDGQKRSVLFRYMVAQP